MTPLTAGTVQGLQLCLVKEAKGEALPLSPGEQGICQEWLEPYCSGNRD